MAVLTCLSGNGVGPMELNFHPYSYRLGIYGDTR